MRFYLRAFSIFLVLSLFCTYLYVHQYEFLSTLSIEQITGNVLVGTQLIIVSEQENACNFSLQTGWNLVSFPCISTDEDVGTFLVDINGSYETVRGYSASDSLDPWKSYNPNLPSWVVHDLSVLSRSDGYWINMDNSSALYINNSLATPTFITLYEGWNLLGYPSDTERDVNDTFADAIPNFDYIFMYNASDTSDPYKQWTWNTSLNSTQDFNRTVNHFGYWIYMLTSDSVIIT